MKWDGGGKKFSPSLYSARALHFALNFFQKCEKNFDFQPIVKTMSYNGSTKQMSECSGVNPI